MEIPDIVLGVIVGVAVVILLISSAAIIVLIRKKCSKKYSLETQNKAQVDVERAVESPNMQLVDEDCGDDVSITLNDALQDDVWIDDMTGVMNHCIPILKGCHDLTSRLVPITKEQCSSDKQSKKVEDVALKIEPALEGVVQLLDGPLDLRLVEARCTSLFYAVSSLCLIIKSISNDEGSRISDWIDTSLTDIETHLKVLQSETQKLHRRSLSGAIGSDVGTSPPICDMILSGTRSTSSRASSSHTDSTESGIDLHTPSERGSEHTPHSPLQSDDKFGKNRLGSVVDSNTDCPPNDLSQCHTIAEVHVGGEKMVEVIEMQSFTNDAYHEEEMSSSQS